MKYVKKIIGYVAAFIFGLGTALVIGARSGSLSYRERVQRANELDRRAENGESKLKERIEVLKGTSGRIGNSTKRIDSYTDRIKEILDGAAKRSGEEEFLE